jgi:hypothetical protein
MTVEYSHRAEPVLDPIVQLLQRHPAYDWNAPFVPSLVWQSKHATQRLGFSERRWIVSLNCLLRTWRQPQPQA